MTKNVLVVSAHPDDEVLGAGGTILKHKEQGDAVYWIIVTSISEAYGFSSERVRSRQQEIEEVAERLGVTETFSLGFPTMTLSGASLVKLIPAVSDVFQKVEPEIIYCLNRSDAHSDHQVIFDAVMACAKSFRYPYVRQVLMYECISETEFAPALPEKAFLPNFFVDISDYLEQKLSIMKIYASELGEHPFPRSLDNIRALAHFRGPASA